MAEGSWDWLRTKVKQGAGQGHGDAYRPFLEVRYGRSSPVSRQVIATLPGLNRSVHFLSALEYHLALLCMYLDADDLREQFPIWPWPHAHPLVGAESAKEGTLQASRGLLEIAKRLGIKHGTYVRYDTPYVATIDLMVTVRDASDSPFLVAIPIKPYTAVTEKGLSPRDYERLQLQFEYCKEIGVRCVLAHDRLLNAQLTRALILLYRAPILLEPRPLINRVPDFIDAFERVDGTLPLRNVIALAGDALAIGRSDGSLLFQYCAWKGHIDIDLSEPIVMTWPMQRGGTLLRTSLKRELFGTAS